MKTQRSALVGARRSRTRGLAAVSRNRHDILRPASLRTVEPLEGRLMLSVAPIDAYPLDEGTGTTVHDTGTAANNGTLMGAALPTWSAERPGGATGGHSLTFTGNGISYESFTTAGDGAVQLANNLQPVLGGSATMEVWIQTTQTAVDGSPWNSPAITGVEQAGGADDVRWGYIDNTGSIGIQAGDSNAAVTATPVNDGQWHHVVMTRDATNGMVQIFVDNLTSPADFETGDTGVKNSPFSVIGAQTQVAGDEVLNGQPDIQGYNFFNGQLDDIRIWNFVLPAAAIAQLDTPPTTAPAPATGVTAAVGADNASVNINWTEPSGNAAGYEVERATAPGGPYTVVATLPTGTGATSGTGTFTDTTVGTNTNYYYQVVAFNELKGGTESAASNTAGPVKINASTTISDIGISFGADRTDPNNNNAPFALAPTDTAGVVPIQNWNNELGGTGTAPILKDSTGAATGVSASWKANGTWDVQSDGNFDQFTNPADATLMEGYLDNFGGTAPATNAALTSGTLDGNGVLINGLPAGTYNIIVYSLNTVEGRSGVITVTGTTSAGERSTAAASTTYVQGQNYLLFPDVVPAGGKILVTPDGVDVRDDIQGIEIIPVSAPTAAPAAPTGVTAKLGANGISADVSFTAAANAAAYQIQRSTSANGPFTTIATMGAGTNTGTLTYNDQTILTGVSYFYKVIAQNTFNNGSQTPAAPPAAGPVTIPINPNDIGFNFGADRTDTAANGGAAFALAATDSAGVVPITNWNNERGGTGSMTFAKDQTGAATTATVSWQANGTWDAATQENMTDQFPNPSGDYTLMAGYLDNFGGTAAATSASLTSGKLDGNGVLITGLSPSLYDVYVYSLPSSILNGTAPNSGAITVTGATASAPQTITPAVSMSYVAGTNYLLFSNVQVAPGGDLLITPDGTSHRVSIQGIELVPKGTAPQFNKADFNHSGKVDFADLLILAQNYGKTGVTNQQGDTNGDGKVDFSDLLFLAQNYNKTGPTAGKTRGTLLSDVVGLVKTH